MTTVAIHQPQFMPWLGYLDKIARSDVFVFLDNVQYKKNEWQNRNRIKTATGIQWLTAPNSYRFPQKINAVRLNNQINWKRKHLCSLITNYSKSACFQDVISYFREFYSRDWDLLVDLNMDSVNLFLDFFQVRRPIFRSSAMRLRDTPNERLMDICETVGADTYLSGRDGAKYMNLELFRKAGIEVKFQDFTHPQYPQLFGAFIPCLSSIDLVFNCGEEGRAFLARVSP